MRSRFVVQASVVLEVRVETEMSLEDDRQLAADLAQEYLDNRIREGELPGRDGGPPTVRVMSRTTGDVRFRP